MAPDQVPPNNFPNTLANCAIRQYARGMESTQEYHARVRVLLERMKREGERYHCEQIAKVQAETGSTAQEMLDTMAELGMHDDAASYRRYVNEFVLPHRFFAPEPEPDSVTPSLGAPTFTPAVNIVRGAGSVSGLDPRVEVAATVYGDMLLGHKGYEKANPETRVALRADAAAIIEVVDKADPLRDRDRLITRMAAGISKSHGTTEPIVHIDEEGAICYRLPALADVILGGAR